MFSVFDAIGNTPLVRLGRVVGGLRSEVFVKLEYYNPTGSYKDRMALAMIEGAEKEGKLRRGLRLLSILVGAPGLLWLLCVRLRVTR